MRPGQLPQSAATLALAALTGATTVASASGPLAPIAQLASLGFVIIGVGLVLRSGLVVGAATIPMLGSALFETDVSSDSQSVRALLVGCLWYLTLEIAWDAIERDDGSKRTTAATARRFQEWTTVLVVSASIGLVSVIATAWAPARTLILQALLILGLLGGLVMALRNVAKSSAN